MVSGGRAGLGLFSVPQLSRHMFTTLNDRVAPLLGMETSSIAGTHSSADYPSYLESMEEGAGWVL